MTLPTVNQPAKATLRAPFLIVNPKAYLTGRDIVRLAELTDELAGAMGIDTLFTAQHADLRMVASATTNLIVTAQHMDAIDVGRGMGHILPESLVDAGVKAVILNHAEHPLGLAVLDATLERARDVGLMTIVCADSDAQCRAVACLGPDIMICEPTDHIGTGSMGEDAYVIRTTKLVKQIDPRILVIQAAGVSRGRDVARVLSQGADGSGGTSGIIKAPDQREILTEMYAALQSHRDAVKES
jgi:triosephosphate isomerase